ncbi:hypothetical protein ABZ816_08200 [Actinosynnema sp. NPDC047251]|uniref:Putative secreted protein n=1 Tax=Saccharothrix espanaensis (strain ATCC 51144 / DSM 44229 / JCM 9112 / NBRC 15066 / NRRL 15764) TaxID=1179773 RepID=K3W4A0_SACES|nr:hypothetical protein [Saccharothrix espanaensis]CCH27562.1 putative secreted protein [Saccharothrix espanaensis DSM 44229]
MIERLAHVRKLLTALRAGAVLVVATVALPLTTTVAGAQANEVRNQVVGHWDTTVRSPGKPPTRVLLEFRLDLRIEMLGQIGVGGEPVYVGTGSWRGTGPTALSFDVTHPLPAPDGTLLGNIRCHQEGTLSADRFSVSGEAFLDQPDGTTAGPFPVSMDGVRVRN